MRVQCGDRSLRAASSKFRICRIQLESALRPIASRPYNKAVSRNRTRLADQISTRVKMAFVFR